MKKFVLSIVVALAIVGLSGCGDEVKNTAYYKQNVEKAIDVFLDCTQNNGYKNNGPDDVKYQNCTNAELALGHLDLYDPWGGGSLIINGKKTKIDDLIKSRKK